MERRNNYFLYKTKPIFRGVLRFSLKKRSQFEPNTQPIRTESANLSAKEYMLDAGRTPDPAMNR
jgi:hypothetical protein